MKEDYKTKANIAMPIFHPLLKPSQKTNFNNNNNNDNFIYSQIKKIYNNKLEKLREIIN